MAKGANLRRAAWLAAVVLAVASVALYWALRPAFGLAGLPDDARSALLTRTGLEGRPSSLRVREVAQIGPYIAVIYQAGGQVGAGLMSREAGTWDISGVPDPGALRQAAAPYVGTSAIRENGIEVVFLAVNSRQVDRVVVRYPGDGTVLDRKSKGPYIILWRPAPAGDGAYIVEPYDRSGRLLAP